jgi:hypothetical protein
VFVTVVLKEEIKFHVRAVVYIPEHYLFELRC